jgi:H+/Cl- antiporter ClcA
VFSPLLKSLRLSHLIPVAAMCTMSATQASATRTPLASALILAMTASGSTDLSVLLTPLLISSYLSIYVSNLLSKKSYFHYREEEH